MKLRYIENLPVFYSETAQVIGRAVRAVVGDDFQIQYLIVEVPGKNLQMILADDFQLSPDSVIVRDMDCMKSYLNGEELSIYEQKLGDTLFDQQGRELGAVSDFIICPQSKQVTGMEVYSGIVHDILLGRMQVPLEQVQWKSNEGAVLNQEGSDKR